MSVSQARSNAETEAELVERTEQLRTVHRHVKEALELLGVDVSRYIPDSWTLREQCHMAKQQLATVTAERDELRRQINGYLHWLGKEVRYTINASDVQKQLAEILRGKEMSDGKRT